MTHRRNALFRASRSLPRPGRPLLCGTLLALLLGGMAFSGCLPKAPPPPPRAEWLPPESIATQLLDIASLEDQRVPVDDRLLKHLRDSSPAVRARLARALGRMQDPAAMPALITLSGDGDALVRGEAYFAIGQIAPSTVTTPGVARPEEVLLSRFGVEPEEPLKVRMVEALGKVGGPRSRDVLLKAVSSTDPVLRGEAAVAIGIQVYRKQAAAPDLELINALNRLLLAPEAEVRWKTAYAFMRAPPSANLSAETRTLLIDLLKDKDPTVRAMAARALGEVGEAANLEKLQESMSDPEWRVRVNCLRAAARLKGPSAMSLVMMGLADVHPLVRQQAVEALGTLQDPLGLQLLEPILNDPTAEPGLLAAAVTSLGQLKADMAVDALRPYLKAEHVWVRMAAVTALGRLPDPSAQEVLRAQAEREDDPRVMAALADALGAQTGPGSQPALLSLMARGDAAVITVTARLVGAHKIQEGLPFLITAYRRQNSVSDWESREAIVEAIGELALRDDRARDVLLEAVGDADYRVGIAAAAAYKKLFHQEVTPTSRVVRPLGQSYFESQRFQRAIINTEKGQIVLALHPEEAPLTVANFVRLARQGFFDGLVFHRVVPGFVAQTGCPRGDGWGGPGYTIRCEVNSLPYTRGTVGMALSGKDTGGSQFFITHSPEPHLDGTYTVFGQVIEGMEIVDQIKRGDSVRSVRVPGEED